MRLDAVLSWAVLAAAVAVPLVIAGGSIASAPEDGDGTVTVYRTVFDGFGSARAVEAAIQNGTVVPSEYVDLNETLVVRVSADRLAALAYIRRRAER